MTADRSATGRFARRTGAEFERTLARDLREALPPDYRVGRVQADRQRGQIDASTAGDLEVHPPEGAAPWGWCIEAKRYAAWHPIWLFSPTRQLLGWWDQAISQADACGRRPVLVAGGPRQTAFAILSPGSRLLDDLTPRVITPRWVATPWPEWVASVATMARSR